MTLGQRIKTLRTDKGLTQKDLADQLHVTFQTVSKWENDENEPDISTLKELAKIFGCSIDELVSGEEESAESNNAEQSGTNQEESKYSVGDAEADLAACKTSAECQALADKLATKGDEYKNIRSKAISKAQEFQKKEGDERKRQENAKAIADIVKEYTQKWLNAKNNTNKANAIIRQAKKALLAKGLSGDITANADGTGLMHVKGK